MKVLFVTAKALPEIKGWYHERNLEAPRNTHFPTFGYWIPGVAAGFIVATDTAVCALDGYITNPSATSEQRDKALSLITDELMELAKTQQFQHVMVISKEQSIINRARELKFTDNGPYIMLSKEI
jgi:hypothetical protein